MRGSTPLFTCAITSWMRALTVCSLRLVEAKKHKDPAIARAVASALQLRHPHELRALLDDVVDWAVGACADVRAATRLQQVSWTLVHEEMRDAAGSVRRAVAFAGIAPLEPAGEDGSPDGRDFPEAS